MHLCICAFAPTTQGQGVGGRDRGDVRGVRMKELDVGVGIRGRVGGYGTGRGEPSRVG